MNPHHACACRQKAKKSLDEELKKKKVRPLLPECEKCVCITSWPRFSDRLSDIPRNQRPVDIPSAKLKVNNCTVQRIADTEEGMLSFPLSHPFADSSDGVVSHRTASIVGHNSFAFRNKIPILQSMSPSTKHLWPPGYSECFEAGGTVAVAPENWIARIVSMK